MRIDSYSRTESINTRWLDKNGKVTMEVELVPTLDDDTTNPLKYSNKVMPFQYDTSYFSVAKWNTRNPLLICSWSEYQYKSGRRIWTISYFENGDSSFIREKDSNSIVVKGTYTVRVPVDSIKYGTANIEYATHGTDTCYIGCTIIVENKQHQRLRVYGHSTSQYDYTLPKFKDANYNPLNDTSEQIKLILTYSYTYDDRGKVLTCSEYDILQKRRRATDLNVVPNRVNSLQELHDYGNPIVYEYY